MQAAVENLTTPSFYPKVEESEEVLSKYSPLILYLLNIEKAFIYLEGARNSQLSNGERNAMRKDAFDLLSQKYNNNTEENQYYGLSLKNFAGMILFVDISDLLKIMPESSFSGEITSFTASPVCKPIPEILSFLQKVC